MKPFAGDKKVGTSILGAPERKFIDWAVPKLPQWITSYRLTLTTILWSLGVLLFGYLSTFNMLWLIGTCVCIFLQWLTDSLDGSLGKARGEGLVKWGYYMDHFLDYIFLCSMLIGYSFLLPDQYDILLFLILGIFGAFMVNSFLDFAVTNQFKIYYLGIGPTEIRIIFIFVNIMFMIFGKTYLAFTMPTILGLSLLGLIYMVYHTQKDILAIDMAAKQTKE